MPSGTHIPPSGLFLPAHTHSSARISNRNWKLLEIAVTPTKHSPDPVSNRNKNTILTNVCAGAPARARSALDCGRSATAEFAEHPRVHTERAPCALKRALPKSAPPRTDHAPSAHRFAPVFVTAGQRSALTRQPLTFVSVSSISNRQWKGLEIPVTHTKQTPPALSNGH